MYYAVYALAFSDKEDMSVGLRFCCPDMELNTFSMNVAGYLKYAKHPKHAK